MGKPRRIITIILLIILLSFTSFLVMVPSISEARIDYGHPLEARWEKNESGEQQAVIKYIGLKEAMANFYEEVKSPIRPSLSSIFLLVFCMGVVFVIVSGCLFPGDDAFWKWLLATTLSIQVILFVAFVFIAVHAKDSFDVTNTLKQVLSEDPKLAEAAISNYSKSSLPFLFIANLLVLILADVVVLLAGVGIGGGLEALGDFIKERATRTTNFRNGETITLVRSNERVEVCTFSYDFKWFPFPMLVAKREVLATGTLDRLFNHLLGGSKTTAFEELRQKLYASYKERFQCIGEVPLDSLVKELSLKLRGRLEADAADLARKSKAASKGFATQILQAVSDKSLSRFQQEAVSGAQESIEASLEDFQKEILQRIRSWLSEEESLDPLSQAQVLPSGIKSFLSKGETSIVVIEEPPQLRTITFSRRFESRLELQEHSYHLAFPYMIFVLVFQRNCFSGLYVFYSNKPLSSLADPVFLANLPNIGSSSSVCLGSDLYESGSLFERTRQVISHFWQSKFNTDLSSNYFMMAGRDSRFSNLKEWERHSSKNPLFVLDVDWVPSGTSISDLVSDQLRAANPLNRVSRAEQAIFEGVALSKEKIGTLLQDFCSSIKVEGRYSKSMADELGKHLATLAALICGNIQDKFKGVVDEEEELHKQISVAVSQAVDQVLKEDFEALSNQVLLRRSGGLPEPRRF